MNRLFLFTLCCLFTAGSAFRATQVNHDPWLEERYFEATSIKEGMTRADLLKLFRMDGGLQQLVPSRYVLRRSSLIKVDVEFDIPSSGEIRPDDSPRNLNEGIQFVPNDKIKIKRISKPYLEPSIYD